MANGFDEILVYPENVEPPLTDIQTNKKYRFSQFTGLDKLTNEWHFQNFIIRNYNPRERLEADSIFVDKHDGTVSLLMEDIHEPSKTFHLFISNTTYEDMQDEFLNKFEFVVTKSKYTKKRLDLDDIIKAGWDHLVTKQSNPYLVEL